MNKKLILSLSSLTLAISPIAVTVSCGEDNKPTVDFKSDVDKLETYFTGTYETIEVPGIGGLPDSLMHSASIESSHSVLPPSSNTSNPLTVLTHEKVVEILGTTVNGTSLPILKSKMYYTWVKVENYGTLVITLMQGLRTESIMLMVTTA